VRNQIVHNQEKTMSSSSNKSFGKWQGAATKTVIVSAIAGALGGISSDASAWPFYCTENCIELAEQRANHKLSQCERAREEHDEACNNNYTFGSTGHQECKRAADTEQESCNRPIEQQRDGEIADCRSSWGVFDCSSG